MQTLKLPKSGQAMEEGTIVEWLIEEGEAVSEHDPVVLFETDKMTSEVTAEQDGVLLERVVPAGETVPIGTVLGYIGDPDEEPPNEAVDASATREPMDGDETIDKAAATTVGEEDTDDDSPGPIRASPSARTAAREADVTVEAIGRALGVSTVRRSHVAEYVETQSAKTDDRQIRGSPYAMKRAEELGVTIEAVGKARGTDRVRAADVEAVAESHRVQTPDTETEITPETTPADTRAVDNEPAIAETIPVEGIREVMFERMTTVATEYGSTTTVARVDVTDLVALREQLAPAWEDEYGVRPSHTAFVVAAVTRSLPAYRILNAELIGDEEIRLYDDINIGIAVTTDDGLLVPTVYDADERSVRELSAEIDRLAGAARDGSLEYDELQHGTFTVSNAGSLGAYINTPQINPPQTAILGICTVFDDPGIVDGEVVPRKKMHLCLTYDHRAVEGATAVEFLQSVKDRLETPKTLLS
ncbi:MAG: dihydrolipoamide acetyltransferase family protein [Halobacteriales archaeon]